MLPPFAVTPLYAALCGLLLVALSFRVIYLRGRHQVKIGDGGHDDLARAIRVQGNFAEYIPLVLLLLFMLELSRQAPVWALHLLGALIFLGRILHAIGVTTQRGNAFSLPRLLGICCTFVPLTVISVWLLLVVLQRYI